MAGIAAYRRHPYCRNLPDPPVLWQSGPSRLLDYGAPSAIAPDGDAGGDAGPAVLFVPSLINRGTVLDLLPDHSMLRFLAGQGIRPILLDWGWPDAARRCFGLDEYITRILEPALQALPAPPVLAGYCMGGLLALAAALRQPDRVAALALLATPWDFHAPDAATAARLAGLLPGLEPVLQASHTLPVDLLQMLFASVEPGAIARKYRAFARLPQDGRSAHLFVALEDWLNDGLPLAAPVARQCLRDWYGANQPARGRWHVAGQAIDPAALRLPSFVAVPGHDRIVPPHSALPLAALIQGAVLHRPGAGHIGMVAGPRAAAALWQPLLAWLKQLPPLQTTMRRAI